jgi:quercetin 2,3-dioxygenase
MYDTSIQTITQLFVHKNNLRAVQLRPGFSSKQSFNFADNYKLGRIGFGSIRVFNEDVVEDQISIPPHPHENFEILSVILSGEMAHQDNLGNDLLVKTNEVKLMSAGSGLYHGGMCFNTTNFLQIWIEPNQVNTPPIISTRYFSVEERVNKWQLQVTPHVSDTALTIKQSLYAYRGVFEKNQLHTFYAIGKFSAFLMPLSGVISLQDQLVETRDSAEFYFQDTFTFLVNESADIWLMIEELKTN